MSQVKAPSRSSLGQGMLDGAAVLAALLLAYKLRVASDITPYFAPPAPATYLIMLGSTVLSLIIALSIGSRYRRRRDTTRIDECYRITVAVSLGLIGAVAVNSLLLGDRFSYSRLLLVFAWLFCILFIAAERAGFGLLRGSLRRHGVSVPRVLADGEQKR
ncbi:MAG: hypothetical protein M3Z04_10845 [Chloroflexota bacterium]|nr:hypothetical protein [Chloroflexota bacterium]